MHTHTACTNCTTCKISAPAALLVLYTLHTPDPQWLRWRQRSRWRRQLWRWRKVQHMNQRVLRVAHHPPNPLRNHPQPVAVVGSIHRQRKVTSSRRVPSIWQTAGKMPPSHYKLTRCNRFVISFLVSGHGWFKCLWCFRKCYMISAI